MNLTLNTKQVRPDGIFSELLDDNGNLIANTLEHAYQTRDQTWTAKIPEGQFICQRGSHRLQSMPEDFTTFEITGVEGHANLLFHWGNYNRDSEGCILVGEKIAELDSNEMITNSRETFAKFMALQDGVDNFTLTVINR